MTQAQRRQVMASLRRANETRYAAAERKREVAALTRAEGFKRVIDLLDHPDKATGVIRLDSLIGCVRNMGPRTASFLLDDTDLYFPRYHARVASLTLRERSVVCAALEAKAH